jgi:hypothetical protein
MSLVLKFGNEKFCRQTVTKFWGINHQMRRTVTKKNQIQFFIRTGRFFGCTNSPSTTGDKCQRAGMFERRSVIIRTESLIGPWAERPGTVWISITDPERI